MTAGARRERALVTSNWNGVLQPGQKKEGISDSSGCQHVQPPILFLSSAAGQRLKVWVAAKGNWLIV